MFRSIATIFGLCLAAVTAQAALEGRAPATSGGTDYQAYYDTTANLAWVADANLASTSGYCYVAGNCFNPNGPMTWSQARAWIASLNAQNGGLGYLGVNSWRLPTTGQPDPTCSSADGDGQSGGAGCTGSEMGYLSNVDGVTTSSPSPFSNIEFIY